MTKYIVFSLGEQKYGMQLAKIDGIEYMQTIVPVPMGPDSIRGIIHLRNEVIPVLDLKRMFEINGDSESQQLLIAETHGIKLAIEVDVVLGIVNAEDEDIKEFPVVARSDRTDCLENVVKLALSGTDREDIVISVAVDRLFTNHEFGQIEDALEKERTQND